MKLSISVISSSIFSYHIFLQFSRTEQVNGTIFSITDLYDSPHNESIFEIVYKNYNYELGFIFTNGPVTKITIFVKSVTFMRRKNLY